MQKFVPFVAFLVVFSSGFSQSPPKRELRAVWIATVANIDFPSQKGLKSRKQRQEFIRILDSLQKRGINAVVVQVRPAADAFYAKSTEPWSVWLTGQQGKAPKPFYDPLTFMVEETHKHCMEFHAWFNPFRASMDTSFSKLSTKHISRQHPDWFLIYDKKMLFNPGLPEVRNYLTQIILNVVRNYDIDGVHFDDYFYPYTVANDTLRDEKTFQQFPDTFTDISNWRRNNVNLLIQSLSDSIRRVKPFIKFGISPFGVWKNKNEDPEGSDTQAGQTTFTNLYADIRLWLQNGWIDYVVPQVYFSNRHPKVNYEKLTAWWAENTFGRHLYIGHGAYRISKDRDSAWLEPSQTGQQIRFNRKIATIQGSIFFSCKSVLKNPLGMADTLQKDFYKYPALFPLMSWKNIDSPQSPQALKIRYKANAVRLKWKFSDEKTRYFAIYRFPEGEEANAAKAENLVTIQAVRHKKTQKWTDKNISISQKQLYRYGVSALDRLQNESLLNLTSKP